MQNEGQEDWRSGLVLKETRYNNEIFERSVFFGARAFHILADFLRLVLVVPSARHICRELRSEQGEVNCRP